MERIKRRIRVLKDDLHFAAMLTELAQAWASSQRRTVDQYRPGRRSLEESDRARQRGFTGS
jgi:hypothetical protein